MFSGMTYPTFWQSDIWKEILILSRQADDVIEFHGIAGRILIEVRSVGMGMYAGFSLGVDPVSISLSDRAEIMQILRQRHLLYWQIEYIGVKDSITLTPYKHFIEPYTRILDLTKSEEDLFSDMSEKCRYSIRLAEKRGISVEGVPPTDEHIDIWMNLLADTLSRDGFSGNSRAYYKSFLSVLEQRDAGGLFFAKLNDTVIAAGIFVYYYDSAIYYYGASVSNREMRKYMASYLLQWKAIQEAKRRGCKIYDFFGIAPSGDAHSCLIGVSVFKKKFGGEILFLGNKELIPLSWRYRPFIIMRFLRNILLLRNILRK